MYKIENFEIKDNFFIYYYYYYWVNSCVFTTIVSGASESKISKHTQEITCNTIKSLAVHMPNIV